MQETLKPLFPVCLTKGTNECEYNKKSWTLGVHHLQICSRPIAFRISNSEHWHICEFHAIIMFGREIVSSTKPQLSIPQLLIEINKAREIHNARTSAPGVKPIKQIPNVEVSLKYRGHAFTNASDDVRYPEATFTVGYSDVLGTFVFSDNMKITTFMCRDSATWASLAFFHDLFLALGIEVI